MLNIFGVSYKRIFLSTVTAEVSWVEVNVGPYKYVKLKKYHYLTTQKRPALSLWISLDEETNTDVYIDKLHSNAFHVSQKEKMLRD